MHLRPATLLQKRPWHRCFSVNFVKFLRTSFLTGHLRWLLLRLIKVFVVICTILSANGILGYPLRVDKQDLKI